MVLEIPANLMYDMCVVPLLQQMLDEQAPIHQQALPVIDRLMKLASARTHEFESILLAVVRAHSHARC